MRFEFLSFELCTMAAESENSDVTEFTEKNDEIANGVDKQKQNDVLLIQIERRKRFAKTKVTKLRHELERLRVKDSEVTDIESMIGQLWAAFEDAQEILEDFFCLLCRSRRRHWEKRSF